jgi:hypothetical protein
MLTTGKIAERVRDLLVLAVRTQDAKARDILIDLACQYQALAGRAAKRGRRAAHEIEPLRLPGTGPPASLRSFD